MRLSSSAFKAVATPGPLQCPHHIRSQAPFDLSLDRVINNNHRPKYLHFSTHRVLKGLLRKQLRLYPHVVYKNYFASAAMAENPLSQPASIEDSPSKSSPLPPRPFIVSFYGEEAARDAEGRTLNDILSFNAADLEHSHDYIQVLFPLPEGSPFNRYAPVIEKETRDAFAENEDLRQRLFSAFKCMADFYAFDVTGDLNKTNLTPKTKFKNLASRTWTMRMNHNHLRMTRIIRCLRILGLEQVAQSFYQALQENADGVGPRSLMYWDRAATRPLHLPPDEPNEDAQGVAWLRSDEDE